jgi:S-adenosylmethionine-diacylglycerol 3-amino-3-carboxypropyl transferase
MVAFRRLPHGGLLEFFGVRPSPSRRRTYAALRPLLSPAAARYWDGEPGKLARGLIHAGRYERYMRLLRRTVIAPLARRGLIERFFAADDSSTRESLFRERWNGWSWRFLTGVMLSRRLNVLLFDKAFFAYLDKDLNFGRHFGAKAEQALVRLPIRENSFLSYILRGRFVEEAGLPLYLRAENHGLIRDRLDRIEIVTAGCAELFAGLPDGSISKFNFSNIFEWMSPAVFEDLLRRTVRVARDGAVLTYRNLLVRREHPAALEPVLCSRPGTAGVLKKRDLSFIYENYVVEEVRKG